MNSFKIIPRIFSKRWSPNLSFISNRRPYSGAYDAPGQTTTTIVNHKDVEVNMIDTYGQMGFRLTNGTFLHGPCIILRDKLFYWDIAGDEDIKPESLEFLFHLYPPLDLLIIGYCDREYRMNMNRDVPVHCRKHGIQLELLQVEKAVQTFNFLVDIRNVAGAFVPPRKYSFSDSDIIAQYERLGISSSREYIKYPDVRYSTDKPKKG